ncbi:MAG TPA: hypothetical protein VFV33_20280, partial [Gemmatimonadaceae bacterium]|nr:hypothetical protein [Gemmatimonadaceae bacterium]
MTRRTLAVAVAGMAALVLGCVQDPVIPKTGEEPIVLTLAFSTTAFKIGRPDTISVIATSTLTDTAAIAYGTTCRFNVTIRNAAGATVVPPNGQRVCIALQRVATDTFPPKGRIVRKFVWTGLNDFFPSGTATSPLPPGTYQ